MDPKASAKSKRTHSQHGRRNHPPPAAIAQKKKILQAGGEEAARRSHAQTLPSNWDRYDGNDEDGAENPVGAKQVDGEIAPKSKGSDFSYLIEQARSQPQDFHRSGPKNFSFDEFPLDFMQGGSSMLSVRGKNLLSWCEDDNFIVDEDPTSSYEVPFLSMDLHALAAQLSKLKVSQRLFIEADLLPEEQCVDEHQKCIVSEEQSEALRPSSDPPALEDLADTENSDDSQNNNGSSSVITDHEIAKGEATKNVTSEDSASQTSKQVPTNDSKPSKQFDHREEVQGSIPGTSSRINPDSKWNKAASGFETAAVEAELDMLLDSFGQSHVSGSVTNGLFDSNFTPQTVASGYVAPISLLSTSREPNSSGNTTTISLDDTIDDLLAETSVSVKDQKRTAFQPKQAVSSTSLPLRSPRLGSGSSREVTTDALDDSIDDLLAKTSICIGNENQPYRAQKEKAMSLSVDLPRSAALGLKDMDDFDSWFDTV